MALQSSEAATLFPADANTFYGEYNKLNFIIQQALSRIQTATIVKVVECTNDGTLSPVGSVNVIPQVNQLFGNNISYPHGIIYGIPYLRIQGGSNAIILDPQPGDLGICVFSNRDLSNVKSTKSAAAPASLRKFDFADGMYIGGLLNGTPTNYIQFESTQITITAPTLIINSNITINGTVTSTGDITANGISLETHVHSGVQTGGSNTGTPVP